MPAASEDPQTNRIIVLCLLIFTSLYYAATIVTQRNLIFDDSYIAYRYAKNLANGNGLSWNPQGPPVEGYTNFLLVVMLAPFIRAGADPLLVARILSILAAMLLAFLLYQVSRSEYEAPATSAILAPLSFLLLTRTNLHCMVGLETVIYTAILFVAFLAGQRSLNSDNRGGSYRFGLLSFAAFLLRPEAILLIIAFSVIAFFQQKHSLFLKVTGLSFGMPLLIYLLWKQQYFGSVVPNSFYLKVAGQSLYSPSGLRSIWEFVAQHHVLWTTALLSVLLASGKKQRTRHLFAGLFTALYLLSYSRIDTLMDLHGRFLYPLTVFLVYLSLPALLLFFQYIFSFQLLPVLKVPLSCALIILACYPAPLLQVASDLKELSERKDPYAKSNALMQREYRAGVALSAYPNIRQTKIAIGDAGVIPYFSQAQHLDVVGLNDRFIARERNLKRLTDYFFQQEPDVIFHPAERNNSWIRYGHGPLGDYAAWSRDSRWDHYSYVGTIRTEGILYDLHLLLRKEQEKFAEIESFLLNHIVDGYYKPFPIAIGSYSPESNIVPAWIPERTNDFSANSASLR